MSEYVGAGDCPEEKESHGNLGVIKNTEKLLRLADIKESVKKDEKGVMTMTKKGLMIKELLESNGWSFYRVQYVGSMPKILDNRGAQKGGGKEYGYVLIDVAAIRKISDEEQRRALCVIDDPEPSDPKPLDVSIAPAHALVRPARKYTRAEALKIRDELLALFKEVKTE